MRHLFVLIIALAAIAGAAQASVLEVTLVSSVLYGNPGDTLVFFATIRNPSATDTIYLNGIGTTAASSFIAIDASPLLLSGNFPLGPGVTTAPFEIFDALLDPAIPAGAYIGNAVSILGGADNGEFTAIDDLADPSFDVVTPRDVTPKVGAPEPGTAILMTAALLALLALRRTHA